MAKLPTLIREAPHIERRIHAALVEESQRPSERDGVLGLSTIGGCERDLWMSLNGIPKDPGRDFEGRILALFGLGHAVEAEVIRLLELAGYKIETRDEDGRQYRRYWTPPGGKPIGGSIDGIAYLRSRHEPPVLLEIKSSSAKKFEELQGVGYAAWNPKYAAQIQAYMGAFKLDDSLVVVYCKDDSRIYAEKIRHDPAQSEALLEKAHRIVTATELPERPKNPIPGRHKGKDVTRHCAHCKWCDRGDFCFSPLAELVRVPFDD